MGARYRLVLGTVLIGEKRLVLRAHLVVDLIIDRVKKLDFEGNDLLDVRLVVGELLDLIVELVKLQNQLQQHPVVLIKVLNVFFVLLVLFEECRDCFDLG